MARLNIQQGGRADVLLTASSSTFLPLKSYALNLPLLSRNRYFFKQFGLKSDTNGFVKSTGKNLFDNQRPYFSEQNCRSEDMQN